MKPMYSSLVAAGAGVPPPAKPRFISTANIGSLNTMASVSSCLSCAFSLAYPHAYPILITQALAPGAPVSASATPVVQATHIAVANAKPIGLFQMNPAPSESALPGTTNVSTGVDVPTVVLAAVKL